MSIEQTNSVDFVTVERGTGDLLLTISDHLPWDEEEGTHLQLLQKKLNSYLRFIESGELVSKFPDAEGLAVVVRIVGRFPLSEQAQIFLQKAGEVMRDAGHELHFRLMQPN